VVYDLVEKRKRTDVSVRVQWDEYGNIVPEKIYWRDGRAFDLRVISKQNRPAAKAGGMGVRYTVAVSHQGVNLNTTYLFFEKGANPEVWFVEEVVPFP